MQHFLHNRPIYIWIEELTLNGVLTPVPEDLRLSVESVNGLNPGRSVTETEGADFKVEGGQIGAVGRLVFTSVSEPEFRDSYLYELVGEAPTYELEFAAEQEDPV